MRYLKRHGTRHVPQWAPIPGSGQEPNSAGGYAWAVDDWTRLRRFLILGSEGGSYYASEWTLTRGNAQAVERCLAEDGPRVVAEIVRVSEEGQAPKNDPAIFALAMAAGLGDGPTRTAALEALPQVARTGTHLFQFATFVEGFRGWGRSLRRAVGRWYAARPVEPLAYQAVKYRQRAGVTHRDLLRLAHPAERVSAGNPTLEISSEHARLFEWIVRGGETDGLPRVVEGFVRAQAAATPAEAAALVREYGLPREAIPGEHLTSAHVWEALLEDMPMTAMIRNLASMTRVGVLAPGSAGTAKVVAQLGDGERIRRARVHPIALLAALRTYAGGRGARGRGEWSPVREVVDALDAAFYTAFETVEPTGKRLLLALDVSGSMTSGWVAGVPDLTPRDASAALALVTAATEPRYETVGFFAGKGGWKQGLTPLAISPRQRLDDAVKTVSDLPFGGTDCALPMLFARAQEREVDTFVIYTDSETWAGDIHPAQALRDYRRASGIDARLVVVGMVSNGFSIADPADQGMLDVVGFDTATPQLISDFACGLRLAATKTNPGAEVRILSGAYYNNERRITMSTIKTFGAVDERSLKQLERCMSAGDAEFGVLCADHHVGYSQPIGGGIAYEGHVSPSGVGYDIGCGNKAVRTDLTTSDLDVLGGVEPIMREIVSRISFGMGVPAQERVDHPVLEKIFKADFAPQRKLVQLAQSQLGTVGSGNHYVNLMEDEEGRVWVGVHFGSRGFGHKTAAGFLALAEGKRFDERAVEGEMDSPPVLFEVGSELGEAYVSAMELAGEYAYAGRDVVVAKVLEMLGAESTHEVHNHHNFAWHEEHFGRTYWVIRKGCTPARPGQEGFVGGSMGDESVILEGVESGENEQALFSTVHGAGRVMSRTQAAGKIRRRKRWACRNRDCDRIFDIDGISSKYGAPKKGVCPDHPDAGVKKVWIEEQVKPGVVDWPAVQARLREQGIVLMGGGADEAPEVYKRLPEVLAAHGDTIRVKHTLRPLGVAMAGRDVYDPYKD